MIHPIQELRYGEVISDGILGEDSPDEAETPARVAEAVVHHDAMEGVNQEVLHRNRDVSRDCVAGMGQRGGRAAVEGRRWRSFQ